MNKRIQELAKQAGYFQERDEDGVLFNAMSESDFNRFAELIVKECANICELNGQSYKHSFTPAKAKVAESTSVFCGSLIKRHFGVE